MKMLHGLKKQIILNLLHGLGATANHAAQPFRSRYDYLLHLARLHKPVNMIEIGVWCGDRAIRFLNSCFSLKLYVGFDLFEGLTAEKHVKESMGNCNTQRRKDVLQRIKPWADQRRCSIELIAGSTEITLPAFASKNPGQFDFIYIDGGHSLETVANDWFWARKLLSPHGLVVFDDYYLNDDTRGAKPTIDGLLKDPLYRVRFFPIIEDIIDDIQITMVSVRPQRSDGPVL